MPIERAWVPMVELESAEGVLELMHDEILRRHTEAILGRSRDVIEARA